MPIFESFCILLYLAVLLFAINKLTWTQLLTHSTLQHCVLASSVIIAGLWSVKAGIYPQLEVHLLAMCTVTLVFGWRFAVLISTLALVLLTLFDVVPMSQIGLYGLTTAIMPILITYAVFLLCYHFLPRHVFVYIFIGSFLTAALTAVVHILTNSLLFYALAQYDWPTIFDNYTVLAALIWFPEATINGMVITLLIIYRPHWVKTFYDKDYLAQ
ncbi:hypothetical protein PULV_a3467 [Pseudoalteromonas ulvae UL12]|uniref:energy-coupling factor ABC transporter permease n=1 Tax=Pseudoalteromonas ulvae TaxID=107327 RepID=UPI00186BA78B|nr:energy-coupling factor ABC transporter permease [Pseudoalteromonas ulvae]MBE0363285.1 hypothetical protein [Pseudoalteromonas ulvae UL12]